MSAPRPIWLTLGLVALALLWAGPLPGLARGGSHAAHMILHMGVVALAAPLLALGLAPAARGRLAAPGLLAAATLAEAAVVWAWHTPGLHLAARHSATAMTLEQASFLAAALLVWLPALAGPPLAGALALFMTAMHMTLLGVLIALTTGPAGDHVHTGLFGLDALRDRQLGGIVMLAAGGGVYVAAGLALAARTLRRVEPAR
ncbi:cytochrome c oxidase assembly protein [Seohaeicola nanhaiensis]|uniref:Cytochrome c oxidase assembly protein n=1 Tax=Seohaeicola nanhaiensis TaxID=1387282 RepID=A0ABV9KLK6_9RHOB